MDTYGNVMLIAYSVHPDNNLLTVGFEKGGIILYHLNASDTWENQSNIFIDEDDKSNPQRGINKLLLIERDTKLMAASQCGLVKIWNIQKVNNKYTLNEFKSYRSDQTKETPGVYYNITSLIYLEDAYFMFGEDDLGKAHAYNYTNEGYKQIINVKENFTKLQSLTGASFECLIRIKGTYNILATIKITNDCYIFLFTSQKSFPSFTIAGKYYVPKVPCSGVLYQLTNNDIALATEVDKGIVLIIDYKKVFDTRNNNVPAPKIIEHENFKIYPVSMVMISEKYLLYVSNEKYVIVDVQTQRVEYAGDIKNTEGRLIAKMNENSYICDYQEETVNRKGKLVNGVSTFTISI